MTIEEKKLIQEKEGNAWIALAVSHLELMQKHAPFNSVEEYDQATKQDDRYMFNLGVWSVWHRLLVDNYIEKDSKSRIVANLFSSQEPRLFKTGV